MGRLPATTSWAALQLADSAFPTGGFAHSAGLEAAWAAGRVRSREDLADWTRDVLWQAAHGSLPFVTAAHADPDALDTVDARCDAVLVSHVANRASRTQGRAHLATCARVFADPGLTELARRVRVAGLPGHLAPVYGATLRLAGVDRDTTARLALHTALRGTVSAAVRLGLLGPGEAQALQHRLGPLLADVLVVGLALDLDDVCQTAPLADLLGATHDRLYSRLFQS